MALHPQERLRHTAGDHIDLHRPGVLGDEEVPHRFFASVEGAGLPTQAVASLAVPDREPLACRVVRPDPAVTTRDEVTQTVGVVGPVAAVEAHGALHLLPGGL